MEVVSSSDAIRWTAAPTAVAIVGSGRSSVEEQFLLKKLADALKAPARIVSRVGPGDGLLVSADRNPNVRGALVTGLIEKLPEQKLLDLVADIDAGRVKTLLVVGEDLTAAGLTEAQLTKVSIVYVGTHRDETAAKAAVVLSGLTVFEKAGAFINQQFRLQKFARAVPGPAGATDDLVLLASLLANLTGAEAPSTIDSVWQSLAAAVPVLAGLNHAAIPAVGVALDATAWKALPFVEGKSLRYDPAKGSA